MITFDGFDELHRNIDQLQQNIGSLASKPEVSYNELFPTSFMTRFSNFTSFDDMLAKSGFKLDTMDDLANIPDVAWDVYIASTTRFANWKEMLRKAFEEYGQKKIEI